MLIACKLHANYYVEAGHDQHPHLALAARALGDAPCKRQVTSYKLTSYKLTSYKLTSYE